MNRRKERNMNKYILPSAAAFLILVIAVSSYTPAMAVARITLVPSLQVVTIPEDDQTRNTGYMILGVGPANTPANQLGPKFYAQYKIIVTLNGLLVGDTAHGLTISCNVAEKDKIINPPDVTTGKTPVLNRQFPRELVETQVKDVADFFVCKFRPKSIYVPADNSVYPGTSAHYASEGFSVGVLDVYYTGAAADASFIADHILVVHATYTVGRQVFYGAEIQDICILGYSFQAATYMTTLVSGDRLAIYGDPLLGYSGCDSAALFQLNALGLWP
jgi:hypothetical protein